MSIEKSDGKKLDEEKYSYKKIRQNNMKIYGIWAIIVAVVTIIIMW